MPDSVYPSAHAGKYQATAMRIVVSDFDGYRSLLLPNGVEFEDYDLGTPSGPWAASSFPRTA